MNTAPPAARPAVPSSDARADVAPVRRFRALALATVAIIYALILVGGIVRASGAGMGCPDWPMCFGQWIPPTDVSELPANYQEIYADRGYAETEFNVVKTWTEYLNRLLGAFTGLAILATLVASVPLRRATPAATWLSFAAFALVCVQGWLGARVVASLLAPGMITLHMLLAQVIVGLVIAAVVFAARPRIDAAAVRELPRGVGVALVALMGLGLLQLVVGTQVREAVSLVALESEARHTWIASLPITFAIHKWYSLPLFAANAWVAWAVMTGSRSALLRRLVVALVALMGATIAVGLGMDRLHVPVYAQPLHLVTASLIFGVQLAILLVVRSAHAPDAVPDAPRRTVPDGRSGTSGSGASDEPRPRLAGAS